MRPIPSVRSHWVKMGGGAEMQCSLDSLLAYSSVNCKSPDLFTRQGLAHSSWLVLI